MSMNARIITAFTAFPLFLTLACSGEAETHADLRSGIEELIVTEQGVVSNDGAALLMPDHLVFTYEEGEEQLHVFVDSEAISSHLGVRDLEFEVEFTLPDGSGETLELRMADAGERWRADIEMPLAGMGVYEVTLTQLVVEGEVVIDTPFVTQQMEILAWDESPRGPDDEVLGNSQTTSGCGPGSSIAGNFKANTLFGGAGNDSLDGKMGDDSLYGQGCDDVLQGGWGSDKCYGGPGTDSFSGCEVVFGD